MSERKSADGFRGLRWFASTIALAVACVTVAPRVALAQDDLLGDEPEDDNAPSRLDEGDGDDLLGGDDDDADKESGTEPTGDDLLGGEDRGIKGGPGSDTAELYRQTQASVAGLPPDEEIFVWEDYLAKYPNSAFRDRIEKRIDELSDAMYRTQNGTSTGNGNAAEDEIKFAPGMLLENINPRTRLQAGLEWGLPSYQNLQVDYEYAILRNFSAHGGIRRRYTGWSIEGGVRYALVKSVRTGFIVSGLADVHMNANPAFFSFKPQLAVGKQTGPVDLHVMGGLDLQARADNGLPWTAGGNATFQIADLISIFVETQLYAKAVTSTRGTLDYRFNTGSFGLKFYPKLNADSDRNAEISLGASAPYWQNYWQYHYGAVMLQVNYYM